MFKPNLIGVILYLNTDRYSMKQNQIILLAFFLLVQIHLAAQPNSDEIQDTTKLSGRIDEVTVTAFRSPYNLFNTPGPVNLLTPMQFEMGYALTTVEALNLIPGVLMHHGTLNTNRLTIRGIGSRTPYATNKIKAYFGEIPLTSGDGETTLEDLENSAISRAEIIKGPSSSLYGAGLAGVILFQPKSVANNFVKNQTTLGSFGTVKNTVSAGISTGKLDVYALGSLLQSEGYRENNKTGRDNILLNIGYSFNSNTVMQVLLKATKMKAFIPSSLDRPTFENAPQSAAQNWRDIEGYEEYQNGQFGASLNHRTQNGESISFATFGSFRDADELRPFNRLREKSDYIGWRARAQKVIAGGNSEMTLTTGLEFFREKYKWATYSNNSGQAMLSDNKERRQYENLFFQMEANLAETYFVSAGVNGNLTRFYYTDHFLGNGDQSGSHNYKPVISPRLGINVVLSRKFSVFGNVSHGFSTPSFEETLLPQGEVNTKIKPETGWSTELGFRSQLWGKILFEASYYRIYIKNLLVARRTGEDAYVGVNAGKSVHPGLETELKWTVTRPNAFPALALMGNATFANYHFKDFVENDDDYSGSNLPGTAKNTWLAMANFKPVKNIEVNMWHRFTGKMPVNDANSSYSKAFGITNAELKYFGDKGSFFWQIKGGIQNIFDLHYASMLAVNAPAFGKNLPRYYYPGNPRNFFVSVTLGLQ